MQAARRFQAMVGTGGIGTGSFFALNGNHTLGREESRGGRFLERRDYCKLHIICHYVARLAPAPFTVLPIGLVGDDEAGRDLLAEMAAAGLDRRFVHALPGISTTRAFCLVYPDGSGGNLTVDDAASSRVDPAQVRAAAPVMAAYSGEAIALAVPEVPLSTRAELLRLAGEHGLLRVASFVSAEVGEARAAGLLEQVDLLALNLDEAATLCGLAGGDAEPATVVAAVRGLLGPRPQRLSITAGRRGSWLWEDGELHHEPAYPVSVAGTAGAGDAHLAGFLAGLIRGLEPAACHRLAALAAAFSVTSVHTIHPGLDASSLAAFATSLGVNCPGIQEGRASC